MVYSQYIRIISDLHISLLWSNIYRYYISIDVNLVILLELILLLCYNYNNNIYIVLSYLYRYCIYAHAVDNSKNATFQYTTTV